MQYLLDTHVLLWWLTEPNKIALKARSIIEEVSNDILVSTVSFWEIAIKISLGKLTTPANLLHTVTAESFKILPILPDEALGVSDLPMIHTDPFDRLLIMQAKLRDCVLITTDRKIMNYPVVIVEA